MVKWRPQTKDIKEKMAVVLAKEDANVWKIPPGLDAAHVRPGHNTNIISTLLEHYFLYEIFRHHFLNLSSLLWRSRLNSEYSQAFLSHGRGRLVVLIVRSTVCHGKSGNGLFACRNFGMRVVMRSYHESLAGVDLETKAQMTKSYEEKCMRSRTKSFLR